MILLWENVCCICTYKFETTKSIIWPVSYLWRKHTTRTVTQIRIIPDPVAGTLTRSLTNTYQRLHIHLKNDTEYTDSRWNKNVWLYFCILRKAITNVHVTLSIDAKPNKSHYICEKNRYGNYTYFLSPLLTL